MCYMSRIHALFFWNLKEKSRKIFLEMPFGLGLEMWLGLPYTDMLRDGRERMCTGEAWWGMANS